MPPSSRSDGPTVLALSRQKLPILDRTTYGAADGTRKGGYVLLDARGGKPAVIVIATGSEVALALGAVEQLQAEGVAVRLVSLPSWELFAAQSPEYRESVLPAAVTKRVAVEAATSFGWERWVGRDGVIIGIDHFGASAPADELYKQFGFTRDAIVSAVRNLLK